MDFQFNPQMVLDLKLIIMKISAKETQTCIQKARSFYDWLLLRWQLLVLKFFFQSIMCKGMKNLNLGFTLCRELMIWTQTVGILKGLWEVLLETLGNYISRISPFIYFTIWDVGAGDNINLQDDVEIGLNSFASFTKL